ncbi:branched-chain amino acid ABC transporter permease [Clostridia bacterium]|nr:branched-chain amino acid ABC transporter permease [Clostridia bacterium]
MSKRNLSIICIVLFLVWGLVFLATDVFGFINSFQQVNIIWAGINVILAVSLNLVVGFTGQLALGHAGFMAIGAYVSAVTTMQFGFPYPLAILAGALVSFLMGILIGLPTLRLRGDYLAIATLGFGEIIRGVLVNIEYVGGAAGINGIPKITNWTWTFVMTVFTVVIINNFIKSMHGKACITIRDDEVAAELMGINTTYYKTLAFSLGAFFAGIAGGLYSHYFFMIQPATFALQKSFDALVMVVLGGLGSVTGAVFAGLGVTFLNAALIELGAFRMVIYSILLVAVMIFRPQGLMGNKELSGKIFDRILPKKGGNDDA